MLQITIKTRGGKWDGSVCRALMEICDSRGHCCQTSPEGKGLYNPGRKNRRINQTDVYKSTKILGNCAMFLFQLSPNVSFFSREPCSVTQLQPNSQLLTLVAMTVVSDLSFLLIE